MAKSLSDKILILAGPTAGGKSAIARRLAEAFNGTIINADSMQLYADLRVLTARPTDVEEAVVPHRLYGVIPGVEACSAAAWRTMALAEITEAQAKSQLPILVGGSGLYIRALLSGLSSVPDIPNDVRATVRRRLELHGPEALHAELRKGDPEMADRLKPHDSQRLARAYEVLIATGISLAVWQRQPQSELLPFKPLVLGLMPEKALLYDRCNRRFAAMVAAGAIEEVRALLVQRLAFDRPVMKALGVPELSAFLAGTWSLDEAIAAAQRSTRRYAKRQGTWFRHQLTMDIILKDSESLNDEIFSFIRQFLLT